jgi:hypothetical protein
VSPQGSDLVAINTPRNGRLLRGVPAGRWVAFLLLPLLIASGCAPNARNSAASSEKPRPEIVAKPTLRTAEATPFPLFEPGASLRRGPYTFTLESVTVMPTNSERLDSRGMPTHGLPVTHSPSGTRYVDVVVVIKSLGVNDPASMYWYDDQPYVTADGRRLSPIAGRTGGSSEPKKTMWWVNEFEVPDHTRSATFSFRPRGSEPTVSFRLW